MGKATELAEMAKLALIKEKNLSSLDSTWKLLLDFMLETKKY